MRQASSENVDSFVLGDVLASRAITHRTEPFLRLHGGQIGYGEVDEMANRVARGLISVGVGPGTMSRSCCRTVPSSCM